MPSFDNSSSEAYDIPSQTPISTLNYDDCAAEKLRIQRRIAYLHQEQDANARSGMEGSDAANEDLDRRINNLHYRFDAVENQISALDSEYHAVVPQNTGYGSVGRQRSSQSPPAPRAPNTSPQR
ncbi:hypothetical protein BOTCAL_0599g00010 [Botryotinia calthae]|uniref:Uncharacterized protein n=1 Tax=Botryotinia calthae TaxID=38488 RepID=A0A4Y8CJQ1_9HELO|nr:hypothetical protein BOTCAL_0599g00010 [Botryotinia calthae]